VVSMLIDLTMQRLMNHTSQNFIKQIVLQVSSSKLVLRLKQVLIKQNDLQVSNDC
jgi:hypothetical protein